MSKVNNKTRAIRSAERNVQIDFESDAAARLLGIEDREALRKVVEDIGKGRRTWGLQAVINSSESPDNISPEPPLTDIQPDEIDGWPLDPHLYTKDGRVVEENTHRNGNNNENEQAGIVNGLDIRGMVPGAILPLKIDRVPENLPPELNIP